MVIRIDLKQIALEDTIRSLGGLPRNLVRIRRGAAKATGFALKDRLTQFILRGRFTELDPLTKEFRSKFFAGRGSARFRRRRSKAAKPVAFLAKLTRYRVDRRATTIQLDFARSRRGQQPGPPDPELKRIITRLTKGRKIRVTKRMRRFFGGTAKRFQLKRVSKKKKRQFEKGDLRREGFRFFPLPKDRKTLVVPPRPILEPFLKQQQSNIPVLFRRNFLRRFQTLRLLGR